MVIRLAGHGRVGEFASLASGQNRWTLGPFSASASSVSGELVCSGWTHRNRGTGTEYFFFAAVL